MLLVSIEGTLIDNIVIYKNELLFSDVDSEEETIYKTVPVNEYVEESDYYLKVQSILYDVLEFDSEANIEAFKECCLAMFKEGKYSFIFEDLKIGLEEIEDYELDIERS